MISCVVLKYVDHGSLKNHLKISIYSICVLFKIEYEHFTKFNLPKILTTQVVGYFFSQFNFTSFTY